MKCVRKNVVRALADVVATKLGINVVHELADVVATKRGIILSFSFFFLSLLLLTFLPDFSMILKFCMPF